MTAISIDKGRIVDTIRAAHPNTQAIYLYSTWGTEYQRRDCFSISHLGETWQAFVCEFMVPLTTPEADIYRELKIDILEMATRSLEPKSAERKCSPGRRKIAVKVVDMFGNDAMTILEVGA